MPIKETGILPGPGGQKTALLSVFVNLVLAAVKIAAGVLSNSASVLAEGIHSSMDILSSGISLVGIKKGRQPVDQEHPYGHYKFEVLAGLLITLILLVTGIWIIYQAGRRFIRPAPLGFTALALGTMLFSALVNGLMARLKTHVGRIENSVSLLSDGVHSKIDVITSLAVLAGVALARWWARADSFLALAVGLYIIKESLSLGKESTDSLLDASAGEEIEGRIRDIVGKESVALSDLRTQKKGSTITANLIIQFPGTMKVEEATAVADKLKKELLDGIPRLAYVALQMESRDPGGATFLPVACVAGLRPGRGFGGRRRSPPKSVPPVADDSGPERSCLCDQCGRRVRHVRGTPCSTLRCPECGGILRRT